MKKFIRSLSLVALFLTLTSCDMFSRNISAELKYWTSRATIVGAPLASVPTTSGEKAFLPKDDKGFYCLPSTTGTSKVVFEIDNPADFRFSSTKLIEGVSFLDRSLNTAQNTDPDSKIDSVEQIGNNYIKVKFKNINLKQMEKDETDLSLKISLNLEDDDRRKFKQDLQKLKVNTQPPKAEKIVIAKTGSVPNETFVICIKYPDPLDAIHDDISELKIANYKYEVEYNAGKIELKNPVGGRFLNSSDVEVIDGTAQVPTGQNVFYYNTGIKTTRYLPATMVQLKDKHGLSAEPATTEAKGIAKTAKINGSESNAWQTLKDEVEKSNGADIIKINGTITAPSGATEIDVTRTVRIEAQSGTATIDANSDTTSYRRIFNVQSGGDLTISNITLTGGHAKNSSGGAVFVDGGSFTMDSGSTISNNAVESTYRGGGIYMKDGTLILQGSVNANTGHGVFMENGLLTLTGKITGNTGNGVHMNSGTFIMNGGAISNNGNSGVHISGGSFTMTGGVISNNTAKAVSASAKTRGGAVLVGGHSDGTFEMTGGTISGNTANLGSAVYVYSNSTFKMSAGAEIDTNNTVFLQKDGAKKAVVNITGDLTEISASEPVIIELDNTNGYTAGRQIITASGTVTLADQVKKFKVKPQSDGQKWIIDNAGTLQKKSTGGGTATNTINGSDANAWKKLKDAVKNANDGDVFIINGTIKSSTQDSDGGSTNKGVIKVTKKIIIKGAGEAGMVDCLDANSKVSSGATNPPHPIFEVTSGALTLQNLTLKNGHNTEQDYGGGALILAPGDCILQNVTIENCTTKGYGGAVYISGGSLSMKSGSSISRCYAQKKGSGIFVKKNSSFNSTFKIRGSSALSPSCDVYLDKDQKITIADNLTGTGSVATITPKNYPSGTETVQVLTAESGVILAEQVGKFKVKDQVEGTTTTEWIIDSAGKLKKKGGTSAGAIRSWDDLKEAVYNANSGATITIDGTIRATDDDKGVIPIEKKLTIQGSNKTKDILDANKLCRIFKVGNGGNLTLKNLTLKSGKPKENRLSGGAVFLDSSILTMEDCIVQNCEVNGGAIALIGDEGAAIENDESKLYKIVFTNVEFKSNHAYVSSGKGGAGGALMVWGNALDVTLNDCTISNNTSENKQQPGAAISLVMGRLHLNGGTISNNTNNSVDNMKYLGVFVWWKVTRFSIKGNIQFGSENGVTLYYESGTSAWNFSGNAKIYLEDRLTAVAENSIPVSVTPNKAMKAHNAVILQDLKSSTNFTSSEFKKFKLRYVVKGNGSTAETSLKSNGKIKFD